MATNPDFNDKHQGDVKCSPFPQIVCAKATFESFENLLASATSISTLKKNSADKERAEALKQTKLRYYSKEFPK